MTNDNGSAVARLVTALSDPDRLFDSDQVVFLMGAAQRWGYEAAEAEMSAQPMSWAAGLQQGYRIRCAEENAAYPPRPYRLVTTAGQDAVAVHRRRERVDERYMRDGDHPGGPVPAW